MSIILLLSAAMGMTTTGGAAPAPPAGVAVGRSLVQVGSWNRGGRGRAVDLRRPFRPGLGRGPGRHHRHPGRHGRAGPDFLFPYGAGGLAGEFEAVDAYGNGFFAGGGGRVRVDGGRPYYDYDRSYPFEWASAVAAPRSWAEEEDRPILPPRCVVENGVRVCRGGR